MTSPIQLEPTATRYVRVLHRAWGLEWAYQFPESIYGPTGWIMDYPGIEPAWRRDETGAWCYEWETTPAYIDEIRRHGAGNPSQLAKRFLLGVRVRAELRATPDGIASCLTLINEGPHHWREVRCDGGCFQARNDAFAGADEVARTFLRVDGAMRSMAALPRTQPIRCTYQCCAGEHERAPEGEGEWFWGRSSAVPDTPAVVGMVSVDGTRAVALGFEGATAASANADEHHCLHSRPHFGDLAPGASVRRRGFIVFGESLAEGVRRVDALLREVD